MRSTIGDYIGLVVASKSLIWRLVQRDITNRTSGSAVGVFWLIAQPALQVLAFWFLLDIVLSVRSSGPVAYLHYFLIAMISWLFISEVLSRSLNVLSEFSGLYEKTLFPIKILPLIPLAIAIIVYLPVLIVLAVVFAGMTGFIASLVIIFTISVWLLPLAYLLAVIGLFIKETRQIFPFLLSLLMYFSPILYQPAVLSGYLKTIMQFNPIAGIIAFVQHLILGQPINGFDLAAPIIFWVAIMWPSMTIFSRAEPHMREVV